MVSRSGGEAGPAADGHRQAESDDQRQRGADGATAQKIRTSRAIEERTRTAAY